MGDPYPKEVREALIPLIDSLLDLSRRNSRLGLAILEKERADTNNPWLEKGLGMVLRGTESDIIHRTYENLLCVLTLDPQDELELRIIMEAMISLCRRDSIHDMEDLLFSVIGDTGREEYQENILQIKREKVETYIQTIPSQDLGNSETGNTLLDFSDRQIVLFLEQVNEELLAPFLAGESHDLQCRVISMLDESSQQEVVEQLETGFLDLSVAKARKLVAYRIRRINGEFHDEEILSQKEVDALLKQNRMR